MSKRVRYHLLLLTGRVKEQINKTNFMLDLNREIKQRATGQHLG